MEPSNEEASAITNVETLADWCELDNTQPSTGESPRASLLSLIGLQPKAHYRAIANINADDWNALLTNWQVNGNAPPPAVLSQAGLVGRTARVLCKVEPSLAETADAAKHARDLELAKANSSTSGNVKTSAPDAGTLSSGHKLKLNQVVDQTVDDEVPILKEDELQACYARHMNRMQGPPDPSAECTGEQLTGISHLIKSNRPPYVDFGIFGPHGYRIRRKVKLAGMVLGPGGVLQAIEIVGPPSAHDWMKCYLVLRTALIMLDQVGLATLDRYSSQITEYANRYGQVVWHIIYQADVRARLEHMERLRRVAVEEAARAVTAGGHHEFDIDKPWNYVWAKMVDDATFWRKEIEEPCVLVLAKTTSLPSMIGGDAPAASSGGGTSRSQQQVITPGTSSAHYRGGDIGISDGPMRKKMRQHNQRSSGHLNTNRSGHALCAGFNAGTCLELMPGAQGYKCSRDPNKVHQCSKCLSTEHGASSCNRPAARQPREGKGHKSGKGKGKGKPKSQY